MIRRQFLRAGAVAALLTTGSLGLAAHAADAVPAAVKSAVADTGRPDADRQRDADRKPAEIVAWAGIKAGDKVAEYMPGGGYFTRIFSKVVGTNGKVYAVVPPRPANAPANMPDMGAGVRALAGQYGNIEVIDLDPAALKGIAPVDVFWTSLNYHDLHNRPNPDLAAFNKMIFDTLKPGGVYIVIDHAAAKGAGATKTRDFHRIDAETVKQEVTSVGFRLDGESQLLRNPKDMHDVGVRDASVRGHTDQFALRFVKPRS